MSGRNRGPFSHALLLIIVLIAVALVVFGALAGARTRPTSHRHFAAPRTRRGLDPTGARGVRSRAGRVVASVFAL